MAAKMADGREATKTKGEHGADCAGNLRAQRREQPTDRLHKRRD